MLLLEIALLFFMYIYYFTKGTRALHMLQQNSYNENNRYIKWVFNNLKASFGYFDILYLLFVYSIYFLRNNTIYSNISMIFTLVFTIYGIYYLMNLSKKEQNKKPLVTTARIKRLETTLLIIYIIPVVIFFLNSDLKYFMYLIISLLIIFNFLVIFLAYFINKPVEKLVTLHFLRMAKAKLASMPNLKIIGITGSYGKTSSKNILNDILSVKYNSKPTPKSLNTYLGIMTTINNNLDKFDEIFICEMGAYVKGEIQGLCDFVHPKYGILTRIGTAHLQTFGSEQNIEDGKFELIESLPEDGIAILNLDDPKQAHHNIKSKCKKVWIGIDNKDADFVASDIVCNADGTKFKLHIKGEKETYDFSTKLLGYYNVYNILAGIALGYNFGIKIKDLQHGVKSVRAVEHRLEVKKLGNFYQIDDAYNANPMGAEMALDVLSKMDGYRVVVTPGMIELGSREEELNKEFGRQIAKSADYVILVGKERTKIIYDGIIESGFDEDKIYVTNDVRESYKVIENLKVNKDIYALFENDLPDLYNEK